MEGKYFLGQVWPFSFPISDYNVGGNVPNPTTNIGNRPSNNSCQAKCAEAGKAKSSKATDNYRKVPYIQASTSTETCSSSQDDSKERQIFLNTVNGNLYLKTKGITAFHFGAAQADDKNFVLDAANNDKYTIEVETKKANNIFIATFSLKNNDKPIAEILVFREKNGGRIILGRKLGTFSCYELDCNFLNSKFGSFLRQFLEEEENDLLKHHMNVLEGPAILLTNNTNRVPVYLKCAKYLSPGLIPIVYSLENGFPSELKKLIKVVQANQITDFEHSPKSGNDKLCEIQVYTGKTESTAGIECQVFHVQNSERLIRHIFVRKTDRPNVFYRVPSKTNFLGL
eukprot:GHVP01020853.1.p1 GENE.GHVP01020853.1~~GHVP01020853.1.p1  ORF type:complete len:341 (+),score=51.46 GHVP01020853.1:228-1250(+)